MGYFILLSVYFSRSDPQNQQQLDFAAFFEPDFASSNVFETRPDIADFNTSLSSKYRVAGLLEAQDGSDHDLANNA